jgi:hypothetical protein
MNFPHEAIFFDVCRKFDEFVIRVCHQPCEAIQGIRDALALQFLLICKLILGSVDVMSHHAERK